MVQKEKKKKKTLEVGKKPNGDFSAPPTDFPSLLISSAMLLTVKTQKMQLSVINHVFGQGNFEYNPKDGVKFAAFFRYSSTMHVPKVVCMHSAWAAQCSTKPTQCHFPPSHTHASAT